MFARHLVGAHEEPGTDNTADGRRSDRRTVGPGHDTAPDAGLTGHGAMREAARVGATRRAQPRPVPILSAIALRKVDPPLLS